MKKLRKDLKISVQQDPVIIMRRDLDEEIAHFILYVPTVRTSEKQNSNFFSATQKGNVIDGETPTTVDWFNVVPVDVGFVLLGTSQKFRKNSEKFRRKDDILSYPTTCT